MLAVIKRIDNEITRVTAFLVVIGMATTVASVVLGVFFRYFLRDALVWSEEVARYAMIWVSMLGGGIAFRLGAHVAVDFIVNAVPRSVRRVIILGGQFGMLIFLVVVFLYGIDVTQQVAGQRTAALRISIAYAYAAIPIGAGLMVYHLLAIMIAPKLVSASAANYQR